MEHEPKKTTRLCAMLLCFCMLMLTVSGAGGPVRTRAAGQKKELVSITAVYIGNTLLVGDSIDLNKIRVVGVYSDGSYETLTDFSISKDRVTRDGNNLVTVFYEDFEADISIAAKKVAALTAIAKKNEMELGTTLKPEDFYLYVNYSDNTSEMAADFTMDVTAITKTGKNVITLTYKDASATVEITGKPKKAMSELEAYYFGAAVIVGNVPDRDKFSVSVRYNDNTYETVKEFELTPSIVQKVGQNTMLVTFGDLTKEVTVLGRAKEIVSIKAEYTGFPVLMGEVVKKDDIKVTATYNDETTDVITNFTITNPIIYKIGDNILTVECDSKTTSLNVRGVEAEIINYDGGVKETVKSGSFESTVFVAGSEKADMSLVSVKALKPSLVRSAMRRIVNTDKYIAMDIDFEDPDLAEFLPMTVKVTVPKGFDKKNFAVFYSPNRKTIMAQMNGVMLKDGTYEFKMFQPGTYIIADTTKMIYVEEIVLDEDTVSVGVGKSISLKPVVYPFSATNQELTYTSSRPNVVEVDENGLVTGLKIGTAIIEVEATDGSGAFASVLVKVKK